MREADDRPAVGAAAAATDGAAVVDEALELVEAGIAQLASLDPEELPEQRVADTVRRLGRLDGRIDGIQARFVAAAERFGLPERSGAGSTTSWVSQQTGRSGSKAARTSRLAKTTETSPELTEAVANGTVGPDQANTIASGLDRDELDTEDVTELLPKAARMAPGMFARESRQQAGRRRQERLRNQEREARDARYYRQWRTEDGSLRFEGLLPPAEGDALEKAVGSFYQTDSKDVPDDQRRNHGQRSADAITAVVEAALRLGAAGDVAGVRPHVTVFGSYEAMAALQDAQEAGATVETDLGTVLSVAAFKKLACEATFRRVVLGSQGQPLEVGRATRNWSPAQRAAIMASDGGCRGPGCDLPPDRCIIHHIDWWENGGRTDVDRGVPLCGVHHDFIHDDGWDIEMTAADRVVTWTAPDGTQVVTQPRGLGARSLELPASSSPDTQLDTQRPPGRDDSKRPPTSDSDRERPGRARADGAPPGRADRARGDPAAPTRGDPQSLPLDL